MTAEPNSSPSPDEPVVLRVYLRGGQTIEMVVTDWGLKKDGILGSGGLTELRWTAADGTRMPYVRLEAVDAVTAHPVPADDDGGPPGVSR